MSLLRVFHVAQSCIAAHLAATAQPADALDQMGFGCHRLEFGLLRSFGSAAFEVAGDVPQGLILFRRWLGWQHVGQLLQIVGSPAESLDHVVDDSASVLAGARRIAAVWVGIFHGLVSGVSDAPPSRTRRGWQRREVLF